MSESTTAPVASDTFSLTDGDTGYATPTETAVEPKKSKAAKPKAPKEKAAKKTKPAKAPKAKSDKPRGRTPTPEKELRRPQLRALEALSAAGADSKGGIIAAITLDDIAKRAKISPAMIRQGLGAVNPESRADHDNFWGYKSLISRGMVKVLSDSRGHVYHLTVLGENTVEKKADLVTGVKKVQANKSGRENDKPKKKPAKKRRVKVADVA